MECLTRLKTYNSKPLFHLVKCFQRWFLTSETRAFDYTYLGTVEWYVRSCVSEVCQNRGDFSSQYGNNNEPAHGPSNRKHARQHPFRTAVTVPARVSSRDFKFILSLGELLQQKTDRGLNSSWILYAKLVAPKCID